MSKLIFLGCLSRKNYPSTCENAIKLIQFLDEEFIVLDDAPCCGSLAYHTASDEDLINYLQSVNDWFKANEVKEIVTICAGCYNYLSRYYQEYLGEHFNIIVKHLIQFVNQEENLEKLDLKYTGEKKLTIAYHDPCHLRNAVDPVIEEARNVLNSIKGEIQLKEMKNNTIDALCCGSGGGVYSIIKENSDYSSPLILKQAKRAHAKLLITPCPFCYTAFKRVKEQVKIKTDVIKFEDFIQQILGGEMSI